MRLAGSKITTLWEWVAIFGSLVAVVVLTEVAGVAPVWQTASAYTVIVFACVIVPLRPAWGRPNFWKALMIALILHSLIVSSAIREFPRTILEFHGITQMASGVVEGLLILGFLWRASKGKSIGVAEQE